MTDEKPKELSVLAQKYTLLPNGHQMLTVCELDEPDFPGGVTLMIIGGVGEEEVKNVN